MDHNSSRRREDRRIRLGGSVETVAIDSARGVTSFDHPGAECRLIATRRKERGTLN